MQDIILIIVCPFFDSFKLCKTVPEFAKKKQSKNNNKLCKFCLKSKKIALNCANNFEKLCKIIHGALMGQVMVRLRCANHAGIVKRRGGATHTQTDTRADVAGCAGKGLDQRVLTASRALVWTWEELNGWALLHWVVCCSFLSLKRLCVLSGAVLRLLGVV